MVIKNVYCQSWSRIDEENSKQPREFHVTITQIEN